MLRIIFGADTEELAVGCLKLDAGNEELHNCLSFDR